MSEDAILRSSKLLQEIDYDACVLTGDYRAQAFGPYEAALRGMSEICAKLQQPIYGVLGNHDTVRMLPGLEQMGIRMLLNECETINRGDHASTSPASTMRIFIVRRHRKDRVRDAGPRVLDLALAHARNLSGGGPCWVQRCSSAGTPMAARSASPLASRSPSIRPAASMGSGSWTYRDMSGYHFRRSRLFHRARSVSIVRRKSLCTSYNRLLHVSSLLPWHLPRFFPWIHGSSAPSSG